MKRSSRVTAGFSLVEIVIALGVAAFCLVVLLGLLPIGIKTQRTSANQTKANAVMAEIIGDFRAKMRLPPGLQSQSQEGTSGLGLHGSWATRATPDTVFFTNDGLQTPPQTAYTGTPAAPQGAVFRATITYLYPPTATTAIATITVSWPAAQTDLTKVEGSIDMFAAVNR
jgi:type II secretory pathway pseudopilin PulG